MILDTTIPVKIFECTYPITSLLIVNETLKQKYAFELNPMFLKKQSNLIMYCSQI